ncbi:hypothetical protein AOLI_G00038240 [Acnodon oligacanthus]
MMECLYLLLVVFHFNAGCSLLVRETPTDPRTTPLASPQAATHQQTAFSLQLVIHIHMVLLLLLFGGVAIIYSRWKGRKSGQNCDHCRTYRS